MTGSGNEPAKLESFISKSDEVAEWLNGHAYEFHIPNEPRGKLAVSHFYVALEQHKSIVLLFSRRYSASASALVRILLEASVKGFWILTAASSTDIEALVKNRSKKKFGNMVKEIENSQEGETGMFSILKSKAWSGMSDYVHTGMVQLSRHIKDKTIEPNFTDKEIIRMLNLANGFGLLSGLWMNSASGSITHLAKFDKKIAEYNLYAADIFQSWNSNS